MQSLRKKVKDTVSTQIKMPAFSIIEKFEIISWSFQFYVLKYHIVSLYIVSDPCRDFDFRTDCIDNVFTHALHLD